MNTIKSLLIFLTLIISMPIVLSQSSNLGGNGFDSSRINSKITDQAKQKTKTVKTIQFIAASPKRIWTSSDQKKITGSLIAFAIEKGTNKVSIIEAGKVRLLIGKKEFIVPMNSLSIEDQEYIKKVVKSARNAGKLIEPTTKK